MKTPQTNVVTNCFDGCGSSHLSETNNYYVCRNCGMTYSKNKAGAGEKMQGRARERSQCVNEAERPNK